MTELLDLALHAHGGLDRWRDVQSLDVRVSLTGALCRLKGLLDGIPNVNMKIDTRRPSVTVIPHSRPGGRRFFSRQNGSGLKTAQDLDVIAGEYSKGLGRTVTYRALPWEEWANRYLKGSGLPEHVANHLATMALRHGENRYDRLTHDVEMATGMKPMTIQEWVRDHASA